MSLQITDAWLSRRKSPQNSSLPTSTAGPRLVAFTVLLMGCFRQSKRRVALFLEQVLGQPCSPGWVVKTCRQQGRSLFPFLTDSIQAHFAHRQAPSLLPGV